MADNGLFQLNDIVLSIPPQQIGVERQSINHQWQTLRTRSSMKNKSGLSILDIKISCIFTDDVLNTPVGQPANGLRKLRDLVSQFRVTPFCFVENQHLRDSILGGDSKTSMALALKHLEISKTNQMTNAVVVNMYFTWFNYFPYTREFSFKKDIFSSVEVKNPAESNAWKMLYKAEQQRLEYVPVDFLDGFSATVLNYNQFASITVKQYQQLEKEVEALKKLRAELVNSVDDTDASASPISTRIREKLKAELGSDEWAQSAAHEVFGNTTTMFEGDNPVTEALYLLDQNLNEDTNSKYSIIVDSNAWRPVILTDGETVSIKNHPALQKKPDKKEFAKEDTLLLERKRSLNLDGSGLITTALSISFENILATIPLVGHPYPTYQHIGSIDARVTLSMTTTSSESVRILSSFYNTIEDQTIKYRQIPAGHRNVEVLNDLVNMCGVKDMLTEAMVIDTVPGSPGTFVAELVLIDNPLVPGTREKMIPGQSFTSSDGLRRQIAKVIQDNLKLIDDPFRKSSGFLGLGQDKTVLRDLKPTKTFVAAGARQQDRADFVASMSHADGESGYYVYSGSKDDRKKAFAEICSEYGKELGNILIKLFPVLHDIKVNPVQNVSSFRLADFFSLTDDEVVGIERIQDDISKVLEKLSISEDNQKSLSNINRFPSVQQDVKDQARLFDTYNSFREMRAQKEDITTEQRAEIFKAANIERNDERITLLINEYLSTWRDFYSQFLDKIIYTGLIQLPEFESVRQMMREKPVVSGSTCYPDFPLSEVVDMLRTSEDPASVSAFERLNDLYLKSGLSTKNVEIAALLTPDFYFYNPVNDITGDLIPTNVVNSARSAIKKARRDMEPAETDWFSNVYEKNLLGPDKTRKVDELLAVNPKLLEDEKTKDIMLEYKQRVDQNHRSRMAPNDLIGSVPPSIAATRDHLRGEEKPVILSAIGLGGDIQNLRTNLRSETRLEPPENSYEVQHRFETDECLDSLPEHEYAPSPPANPSAMPPVKWPTDATVRIITSKFGRRNPPKDGASGNHEGIDLAAPGKGACLNARCLAAATGEVIDVTYDYDLRLRRPEEPSGHEGVRITMKHDGGLVTRYLHLQWDEFTKKLSDVFWKKGDFKNLSEDSRRSLLRFNAGDPIARIGNTGHGTGPHLHFETHINGSPENPERILAGDFTPSRGPLSEIDPNNESLLSRSIQQFEKEMRGGQGYGMVRAYPAFKLYFIESDFGERRRFLFDDFFSYSSVKSIQVVRSRRIAADLCVLELTNISGVLSNRKFHNALDPTHAFDKQGNVIEEDPRRTDKSNTVAENPIASLMLQPGIQVQLRLGYSNNPEELETLFNGVITDVEFSDSDDLVFVTCQSYAIELVQTIQGEVKEFGGLFSGDGRTEIILNEMLAAPEVVHFGRWEGGDFGINTQRGLLTNRWRLVPAPQDDNLFPPQGPGLNIFKGILRTSKYVMYNTTIWDVLQEMTFRHPSYVVSPVPYEGKMGPRMTLFFGLPDQLYFARDSSYAEDNVIAALNRVITEAKVLDDESEQALETIKDASSKPTAAVLAAGLEATKDNKLNSQRQEWFKMLARQYALDKGFIKPFRAYHVLTSTMHILNNSVSASAHNTFNTVTVQYSDGSPSADENTGELNFGNLKTFTLKADAAVPDEETRELLVQYPNCVGEEMAKRYALSLLALSLRDAYKGIIEIVGNPKVKPYDVCYVFDEYTDMYGPVEVEQVVHMFTQETGFKTQIVPDLMVHVNQHATLTTSDAMGLMAEHALKSMNMQSLPSLLHGSAVGAGAGVATAALAGAAIPLVAGAGVVALAANYAFSPIAAMFFNSSENALGINGDTSLFGMMGTFIFRKLITRTQLAHPFRFSPLVLGSKPMVGGLPNRKTDGSFIQSVGLDVAGWFKDAKESAPLYLDDLGDRMNPNNWAGKLSEGDFAATFFSRKS